MIETAYPTYRADLLRVAEELDRRGERESAAELLRGVANPFESFLGSPAGATPVPPAQLQPPSPPETRGGRPAAARGELVAIAESTARKYGVDPLLVKAVIGAESNWNPAAVSRVGAGGLMQLMPETARSLGVGDVFDPAQNIDGGVRFLSDLLKKYGSVDKALAAYNFGPGNVDRGRPWPRETRDYVAAITSRLGGTVRG